MSKAIQVLAQMASDSNLQNSQEVEALLASTSIDSEQKEAIITNDVTSLERQLDICPDIVCLILPADDEENEQQEGEDSNNNEVKEAC